MSVWCVAMALLSYGRIACRIYPVQWARFCLLFITVQIPGPINQFLRDYQRDGVQFLYDQYRRSFGGLLCDDMGLGKTVQVRIICSVVHYAKLM